MSEWDMFLLHTRTRQFQRRVEEAMRIVRQALAMNVSWYVAFSGGKDSTVVLDLVHRCNASIPAVWGHEDWHLPETLEFIDRLRERGVRIIELRERSVHAEWFITNEDGVTDRTAWNEAHGWDGAFIGIRAEESGRRRVFLRRYGTIMWNDGLRQWECFPLAWWSTLDVWAYIASKGIDYNRAYDVMRDIGVPLEQRRIGPFANRHALGYGQLAILKRGWPEIFNQFAAEHSEARLFI